MVCRLVKKKDIRISEESLGKKDSDLQVIFDFAHLLVMESHRNSKAIKHLGSICFSLPTSKFAEFSFQLCSPETILFREILLGVDGVPFLHNIIEMLISHDNSIKNLILVILEVVLLKSCKSFTRSYYNLTCIRLNISRQYLKECGFTCSIGTDDTIAVTRSELKVYLLEEDLCSIGKGNVGCCNHSNLLCIRKGQLKVALSVSP